MTQPHLNSLLELPECCTKSMRKDMSTETSGKKTLSLMIRPVTSLTSRVELPTALRDVSRMKNISARRYARGVLTVRSTIELRRDT